MRTGRHLSHRADGIGATGRTGWLVADVVLRAVELCRCRRVRADLLLLDGPGRLGAINLLEIGDTGVLVRRSSRSDEVRNRDRGQEADNGDDDHDFDEGKCVSGFVHVHSGYAVVGFVRVGFSTSWSIIAQI